MATTQVENMSTRLFVLFSLIKTILSATETIYLNNVDNCNNKVISGLESIRIESSSELTYQDAVSCNFALEATSGKKLIFYVNRFLLEEKIDSKCVDYIDILENEKSITNGHLCGEISTDNLNFTSSSSRVDFKFITDSNADFRGFEIVVSAFNDVPCSANQLACESGICISNDLRCDGINQCGRIANDEQNCQEPATEEEKSKNLGLILGLGCGGFILLIIIIVVLYRLYLYYKYLQSKKNTDLSNPWRSHYDYEYPITDKYLIFKSGEHGRKEVREYTSFENRGAENIISYEA